MYYNNVWLHISVYCIHIFHLFDILKMLQEGDLSKTVIKHHFFLFSFFIEV